jgi:polar amino acid transport system permease protein
VLVEAIPEPDEGLARFDDHVERRPTTRLSGAAGLAGRWLGRLLVLLVIVLGARLLINSKAIEWGVVGHYFTAHSIVLGALTTLYLTALSMVIGVTIGVILALMRLSSSILLNLAASFYLWLFRGTPLLVQILFWFNLASFIQRISLGVPFGGPTFASWSTNSIITPLVAALVSLGLNQGAYMCEIVRAGILSVEDGQMEASLALGMTRGRAMRRVVIPQAMRVIIPPTANHAIALLKDTSLVSIISMTELLYSVQAIYQNNFQTIPLLVVASLWYLLMTSVTSIGQYYLERHFGRGARRNAPLTIFERLRSNWIAFASRSGGQGAQS